MGRVYCARDLWLQRNVALKVLHASTLIGDDDGSERVATMARLIREARAAAALEHPNIVTIYDVGELSMSKDGEAFCFLAMELIEGQSLRNFIGRKDVSIEQRVAWLADVARALAFAHARGVIHRDIKPDNVMVREDGVVKVLDFGLARRTAGVAPSAGSDALPTLTKEGSAVGTPLYMAPEQMRGAVLDGRADQFSWGVIAYELLAGQLPWPVGRDSIQLVAQMLMHDPAPLCTVDPTIPPELAEIVRRAMARDKEDRFGSMDDVLDAVQGILPPSRLPARAEHAPHDAIVRPPPHAESSSSARGAAGRTPPAPSTRSVSRSRTRPVLAGVALAAVLVVVAAAAVGTFLRRAHDRGQAASEACVGDCGEGRTCSGEGCDRSSACRSNAECTRARGAPAVCRADTRACVDLASEDCHVVAEAGDVENEATVWFGTMFPLVGDEALSFGKREFQAVELARSDFARMLRGANARPDAMGVHPLAIVACDDSVDSARAARHLVDEIGVPAIIGFRTSKEVIDLATSIFTPRGVLTIAALNTSPVIASLPGTPGLPRMVFRTTYSSAQAAAPIGLLVADILEPEIRAQAGLRSGNPVRVALVRQDDAAGIGFADALFRALRFNGRSALENESNYREMAYTFDASDGAEPDFDQLVEKLRAFAPHVLIHFGADETFLRIVEPLERAWKAGAVRPRYVKPTALAPEVLAYVGKSAERKRRFFSITSVSTTSANARFVARYSEAFADAVTRTFSPNSSYDAFYVLAYATFALGRQPVTGASLARAIGRLVPPGRPIEVGPSEIFDALNTLSSGEHIDLNGATGRLDFDMDTGEAPVDLAVLCVRADPNGLPAQAVESGLTYDARSGTLRGAMRCP
jgi:serine/threonine-protein kinase